MLWILEISDLYGKFYLNEIISNIVLFEINEEFDYRNQIVTDINDYIIRLMPNYL